ncbi:predicted protein [Naegleria gruberi]|uniref:Predicted protein n=1 Tax=Naegleria gruberi TaxID=5762 RepID=D2VPT8_NAEGR|nr:uncharacterized protein NAEGRDRAFT_70983 [Naegleria gruberi]EFC41263.1 predicted protein [Naegleria gruberi]|eukprot:XP_002674007.1 predicted protein [Naegleria gruberi strain NEG-M]
MLPHICKYSDPCALLFSPGKEDVIIHILLFITDDAKELERWRRVSKFWNELITCSNSSDHHHHAQTYQNYAQLLWKELYWKDFVVTQLERQWIEFKGSFERHEFHSEQFSEFSNNVVWKRRDLDWRFLYLHRDIFLGFYNGDVNELLWVSSLKNEWRRNLSESDKLNLAMLYYEIEGSKNIALEMERSIVNLLRHRKNAFHDFKLYKNYIQKGEDWKNHLEQCKYASTLYTRNIANYQSVYYVPHEKKLPLSTIINEIDYFYNHTVIESVRIDQDLAVKHHHSSISIKGLNGNICCLELRSQYSVNHSDFSLECTYPKIQEEYPQLAEAFEDETKICIFRRQKEPIFSMNNEEFTYDFSFITQTPYSPAEKSIFHCLIDYLGFEHLQIEHLIRMIQILAAPTRSSTCVFPFITMLHNWVKENANLSRYSCVEAFDNPSMLC